MTLCDKIKLIDEMIRENPDVTIKDYIDLSKEIGQIKAAQAARDDIKKEHRSLKTKPDRKVDPKYINRYRIHF